MYVYTKPGPSWANATETAELTASDGAAGDELGLSVAVSGVTITAGEATSMLSVLSWPGITGKYVDAPNLRRRATAIIRKSSASGGALELRDAHRGSGGRRVADVRVAALRSHASSSEEVPR